MTNGAKKPGLMARRARQGGVVARSARSFESGVEL